MLLYYTGGEPWSSPTRAREMFVYLMYVRQLAHQIVCFVQDSPSHCQLVAVVLLHNKIDSPLSNRLVGTGPAQVCCV